MTVSFRGYGAYKSIKENLGIKTFYFLPTISYHYDDTFDDLPHEVQISWLFWNMYVHW